MGGRTLAGDTAESCERSVIDTRIRVYSGQARAASLAETVGTTTPAFLLRRVYYIASMSWALSADVNRDRFNTYQQTSDTSSMEYQKLVGVLHAALPELVL